MGRKKTCSNKFVMSKDDLGYVEDIEENGICDLPTGETVAQFTFDCISTPSHEPLINSNGSKGLSLNPLANNQPIKLTDNRTQKSQPNGITPPVDGEFFDIKRSFTFRKSTIRKLNELKASHPDINVYLSSIVDKALCHYYEYITKENEKQH